MRSPILSARYEKAEILEVECPHCGAAPQSFCNRKGDWLTPRGRSLLADGAPPSHQERMWARQGHDEHEFAGLRAKIKHGRFPEKSGEAKLARLIREANALGRRAPAHPDEVEAAPYPRRYRAERICPECKLLCQVQVCVVDPWTVGYRCDRGHKWLYTAPKDTP